MIFIINNNIINKMFHIPYSFDNITSKNIYSELTICEKLIKKYENENRKLKKMGESYDIVIEYNNMMIDEMNNTINQIKNKKNI